MTPPTSSTVRTSRGVVRGSVVSGVARFLGIPYAAAPVGALRFRAPEPAAEWAGVRDATAFGPTAPKGDYPDFARAILPEVTVPGDDWLNLNVWTPSPEEGGLPVFVWVHGGSFTNGSGSVAEYDGSRFAADGVVCVTINYRLGAEGFALLEGTDANRGLLDVVAALQWVRSEIAAFAGDPARVTLAGESAGAMAVAAVLAMPAAEGLFQQAVLQSGAGAHLLTRDAASRVGAHLAEALDATPTVESLSRHAPADVVRAVSTVTAEILTGRPDDWGRELIAKALPFGPSVDGEVVPLPVADALAAGASASVPLLVSTTRDEYRLFTVPSKLVDVVDDATLRARAQVLGVDDEELRGYRTAARADTPGEVLTTMMTDQRFVRPALALLRARPEDAAPAWLTRFEAIDPADNGGMGTCHTTDVPLVFGTAGLAALILRMGRRPLTAATATAHGAWVRFVSSGDPGWPSVSGDGSPVARLGDDITAP